MLRRRIPLRKIPENLGNSVCGVWPYMTALGVNAGLHTALFFYFGAVPAVLPHLALSFLFFIYPFYFIADVIWSLRPSVCAILAAETQINRRYYMNTARRKVERTALMSVTISIPVYTEDNAVIFETLRNSIAAARQYRAFSGLSAGVLVSDDGLAVLCGGRCSRAQTDALIERWQMEPGRLTPEERQAAERMHFYRTHDIGFVARPAAGRPGLFKKASNLNYTLRLGDAVWGEGISETGAAAGSGQRLRELTGSGGAFAGGYAEGDIRTREIILLLDKDSGVKPGIIEAVMPEFAADDRLAYVQCATKAQNLSENYFSYAVGHHINNLFHNIWPCKALQGFFVPMIGHNVFLRKSLLKKSGLWSEQKVSEDYDKAICLYGMGYHGKYAQIRGLEFTEYVSRTFAEETGKMLRYTYGLFEMIFEGTVIPGRTRRCDVIFMLLYMSSILNSAMLLPTVLGACYFGNIHLLWAGFIFCNICFILLPCLRGLVMRRRIPGEESGRLAHTLILALSFVGHAYAMLCGTLRYLTDKLRQSRKPFPSTNVDALKYRFRDGLQIIARFAVRHKGFVPVVLLCLDRGIFIVTRRGIDPATVWCYSYILFGTVLAPILLTPQIFSRGRLRAAMRAKAGAGGAAGAPRTAESGKAFGRWIARLTGSGRHRSAEWGIHMQQTTPEIIGTVHSEGAGPSDLEHFNNFYQALLDRAVQDAGLPERLTAAYRFESCIRQDPDGRKALYILKRRADGARAILRMTRDCPEEDALAEAAILSRLRHPGIPTVYEAFEAAGSSYIVREYIEGRSLYEVVQSSGVLSASDIFGVMLKLIDILAYLHAQDPPVIHRDIKPQNILIGPDGSVHLIDFGIARVLKVGRKQDTAVVLTLDYAPPEQYGFDQTSPLADIYASGVVMLFMATGQTARSGLSAQIVNNRLRTLIERCIAFDPRSRIQSVQEMRAFILRNTRLNRRSRGLAVAGAVAAIGALSAVSYAIGLRMGARQGRAVGYENGYGAGYTDGYGDVPVFRVGEIQISEGSGNLPGNQTRSGGAFAAQNEDFVFYILDGDIYRMSIREAVPEILVEGRAASALSCYNGWLYYSSGPSILQTNLYTLESHVLSESAGGRLHIADDAYYILNSEGIYRLDIDDGSLSMALPAGRFESVNVSGETAYFTTDDPPALQSASLAGDARSIMLERRCDSICAYEGRIYCSVSETGGGEILQLQGGDGAAETITEAAADSINVTDEGIFYMNRHDGTLVLSSLDGRIRQELTENQAGDFNIAGGWVFYHNKDDAGRLWCVRIDGTNDHRVQSGP